MATHARATAPGHRPGALVRVSRRFFAQDSREQASTRHGDGMRAQLLMLTLMHDARARLELSETMCIDHLHEGDKTGLRL